LRGNCDHQTFTVSLDTTNLPDVEIIFQYGFFLEGPATNQEGSIFIQVEDDGFPFDEHVGFMSDDD
jgi:hypothetical protein